MRIRLALGAALCLLNFPERTAAQVALPQLPQVPTFGGTMPSCHNMVQTQGSLRQKRRMGYACMQSFNDFRNERLEVFHRELMSHFGRIDQQWSSVRGGSFTDAQKREFYRRYRSNRELAEQRRSEFIGQFDVFRERARILWASYCSLENSGC
jgi:hypothetical protein